MLSFSKEFLLKLKQDFDVSCLNHIWVKNKFNILVLNMGCFLKLLKLDGQLLEKQTRLEKIRIEQQNQYLNLKFSQNDQRSFFT